MKQFNDMVEYMMLAHFSMYASLWLFVGTSQAIVSEWTKNDS